MLAFTAFVALGAAAQKMNVSAVPPVVKHAFEKAYPGVTATWEEEAPNYEVNFKKDGSDISVLIDKEGKIIETETDIKAGELPAAVLSYIKAHYKGKAIKETSKITRADGTVNYEAEVNGKDVIFDASGKFLKEAKD